MLEARRTTAPRELRQAPRAASPRRAPRHAWRRSSSRVVDAGGARRRPGPVAARSHPRRGAERPRLGRRRSPSRSRSSSRRSRSSRSRPGSAGASTAAARTSACSRRSRRAATVPAGQRLIRCLSRFGDRHLLGLRCESPAVASPSVARSASATTFSGRPEIWLALRSRANASCSESPSRCMRRPFARSIAFRAASASASELGLLPERDELVVARARRLDRGQQVGLAERLHEVAEDAGLDRSRHELALAVRGHHHDRDRPLVEDAPRGLDPVEARHLHVEERDVRLASRARARRPPRRPAPPRRPRSPAASSMPLRSSRMIVSSSAIRTRVTPGTPPRRAARRRSRARAPRAARRGRGPARSRARFRRRRRWMPAPSSAIVSTTSPSRCARAIDTCVAPVLERVLEELGEDERERRRLLPSRARRARARRSPPSRRRGPGRASPAAGRRARRGRRRPHGAPSAPRGRRRSRGSG